MNPRIPAEYLVLALFSVVFSWWVIGCGIESVDEIRKPKYIVVIGIDTLRSDHLGSWGHTKPTSPVIDGLAETEAVLFENAYSSSSWTLPSMTSIFTSLHPMQHQVVDRGFRLDPSLPTLAGLLGEAGWRTAAFVTHIYVSSMFGLDSGFEEFYELSIDWSFAEGHQIRADALNSQVLPWIADNAGEQFFLYLHYFDPHWDYDPPEPWSDVFTDRNYKGRADGSWSYLEKFLPTDRSMSPASLRRVKDLYDGEILWTDSQIGVLIEHLKDLGLWQDTLLVLLADHGEEFQDHGSVHHIRTLYEEVLRVPILIRPPGGRGADTRSRVPERVRNIDIAPTILEIAGVEVPDAFEGGSLRPLMYQAGSDRRVFAHTQRHMSDKAALIEDNMKLIYSWAPGQERTELYDLAQDHIERNDLTADEASTADELTEKLLDEIQRMKKWSVDRDLIRVPTTLTDEQVEHLRALGYVN